MKNTSIESNLLVEKLITEPNLKAAQTIESNDCEIVIRKSKPAF